MVFKYKNTFFSLNQSNLFFYILKSYEFEWNLNKFLLLFSLWAIKILNIWFLRFPNIKVNWIYFKGNNCKWADSYFPWTGKKEILQKLELPCKIKLYVEK